MSNHAHVWKNNEMVGNATPTLASLPTPTPKSIKENDKIEKKKNGTIWSAVSSVSALSSQQRRVGEYIDRHTPHGTFAKSPH